MDDSGYEIEEENRILNECLNLQQDELSAINAIYSDLWKCIDINKFQIAITSSDDNSGLSGTCDYNVELTVVLTPYYPVSEPPLYEISAPWMKPMEKDVLNDILLECYLSNYQEPVLFKWINEIKDFIQSCTQTRAKQQASLRNEEPIETVAAEPQRVLSANISVERMKQISCSIVSSDLLVDRKSYFQGHCVSVFSLDEIEHVIMYLKSIPKIERATHNVMAYRFHNEKSVLCADHDDDGEHNAGGRLAHLLEITKVENVLVVVSRWFGGILLGPDRFKHINQAARNALVKGKFIK